jgi:hypothetical protein
MQVEYRPIKGFPAPRGEKHGMHILDSDDVRAIRAMNGTNKEVAAAFPAVTVSNVSAIRRGQTWKHLR